MFRTISEVREANAAIGHHWFSRDTMRFFNSRIVGNLIDGRFFVSSERYDDGSPRLYTIREAMPNGEIETVGEFQAFASADAARRAIRSMIREEVPSA